MKRSHLAALLLALPATVVPAAGAAAASGQDASPQLISVEQAPDHKLIEGSYIITLKSGAAAKGLMNREDISARHLYTSSTASPRSSRPTSSRTCAVTRPSRPSRRTRRSPPPRRRTTPRGGWTGSTSGTVR
ncbi:hypothetical protein [Streptomyces sp. NTK 937]|uniref:hypothetical protein n=1 Tax=Streptomyces sp. NTK 937 TaxID=1487711 RepID=UPI001F51C719|nr:hypothetical protein [Streptomyces sp. NTK 937]WSX35084.1 hypothetical protein OG291_05080 [Streptomyces halstedii]